MNIRKKISVCLNLFIILTVIFSTVSLFMGFHFMGQSGLFEPLGLKSFKYFTVDSNILAALVSIIYLIYILNPANKSHKLSILMYVLKLAATTGVTLTMLVTVFFLAPGAEHYYDLFLNTNFFMHLLTPLLCIITFVFFEPVEKNSFLLSFTGIIPMLLYALYYIPNIDNKLVQDHKICNNNNINEIFNIITEYLINKIFREIDIANKLDMYDFFQFFEKIKYIRIRIDKIIKKLLLSNDNIFSLDILLIIYDISSKNNKDNEKFKAFMIEIMKNLQKEIEYIKINNINELSINIIELLK